MLSKCNMSISVGPLQFSGQPCQSVLAMLWDLALGNQMYACTSHTQLDLEAVPQLLLAVLIALATAALVSAAARDGWLLRYELPAVEEVDGHGVCRAWNWRLLLPLLCQSLTLKLLPAAVDPTKLRLLATLAVAWIGEVASFLLSGRLVAVRAAEEVPVLAELLIGCHRIRRSKGSG